MTQRWERWIERFAEEVTSALVAHGRSDQAAKEMGRLASGIAQLSIGNAERGAYEERLELAKQDRSNKGQHAAPGDIAAMFQGHIAGFDTWKDRLCERVSVVIGGAGYSVASKSIVKASNAVAGTQPKLLKDRFRSTEQFNRFLALLMEHRIVDAGGAFLPGHGQKSRLWGAYEGVSENPSAMFSIGTDAEVVVTLNTAFPSLHLSPSRPQDLRGTNGHTAMRSAFKGASLPQ